VGGDNRSPPRLLRQCTTAVRHQITELFARLRACLAAGVTVEDDMVTDAALWFLLAGMIGFIVCGCHYTRLTANRYGQRTTARPDRTA
jgi:hypothetical protein